MAEHELTKRPEANSTEAEKSMDALGANLPAASSAVTISNEAMEVIIATPNQSTC